MGSTTTLVGRVGKEPEMTTTQNGTAKCKFSMAIDHHSRGGKETDWWHVICFGKVAENVEKFVFKGMVVEVSGDIRNQSYEKDGQKKTYPHLTARGVQFWSRRDDEGAPRQQQSQNNNRFGELDDDVPF